MPRIIFWNVNRKDLTGFVCAATASTNADVVVLIENNVSIRETLEALQANVSEDFYHPTATLESDMRFHCFCRNRELDLYETHSESRISVGNSKLGGIELF